MNNSTQPISHLNPPLQFTLRVYGILIDSNNRILVSDEYIRGGYFTKFPGGGLEFGEGTRDCLMREFKEESGLDLEGLDLRGFISFPNFKSGEDWFVFLYTASKFSGTLIDSAEGDLSWIENSKIMELPLWEGDKIFLPWLEQDKFFTACFYYVDKKLISHRVSFC